MLCDDSGIHDLLLSGLSNRAISRKLGESKDRVAAVRKAAGIESRSGNSWLPSEIATLRSSAGMSTGDLCRALPGRSQRAIANKLKALAAESTVALVQSVPSGPVYGWSRFVEVDSGAMVIGDNGERATVTDENIVFARGVYYATAGTIQKLAEKTATQITGRFI